MDVDVTCHGTDISLMVISCTMFSYVWVCQINCVIPRVRYGQYRGITYIVSICCVLMVVGEFVLAQEEDNSLRVVITCNISIFEALMVVDVMYQVSEISLRGYPLAIYFYVLGIDDCWCVSPKGSYIPNGGILCNFLNVWNIDGYGCIFPGVGYGPKWGGFPCNYVIYLRHWWK